MSVRPRHSVLPGPAARPRPQAPGPTVGARPVPPPGVPPCPSASCSSTPRTRPPTPTPRTTPAIRTSASCSSPPRPATASARSSADPEILAAQRKNKTTEQTNLEAIRLLNAADISVHASYIAGAPGERDDSLDRTIDGIRQMLGEVELASVEFSRFIPLPDSPAWDILVDFDRPSFFRDAAEIDAYLAAQGLRVPGSTRLELRDRFGDEDLLDINALADVWMEHFTHVDAEHALGRIAEADAMIAARHVNTGNNVG